MAATIKVVYLFASVIVFIKSCAAENEPELVFANLIWRHGSRSALYSYPSDPYNNKPIWPQGPGQLTQVGMRQEYELGRFFRQRYGKLLSEEYKRSEIYIRSTDVDRTLMSAECNMAALYPPSGRQKWNGTNTTWQPIPVHTIPVETDYLLRFPLHDCPKYSELSSQIVHSPIYQKIEEKYAPFLKELANFTQWDGTMNIKAAWDVEDALVCEKAANLALPSWVTDDRLKKLNEIAGIDMGVLFGGTNPGYQVKIAKAGGAGLLVKAILDNIQRAIDFENTYKVVAYSAHDTTLSALLNALQAYNMRPPPFASAILFEVYKQASADKTSYFVKTFYRNSTVNPALPLSVLGCSFACPFEELKQRAVSVIPVDIDKECERTEVPPSTPGFLPQKYMTGLLYAATSLLLFTWIVVIYVGCISKKSDKKSKVKRYNYQPLASNDNV
ncbi:prostatic acid phosphatase-like [Clavelina lepadiformis]|uniref:prostatic acid phosphatase-like n=1 Tax=Clavelina lepadiformis TaxID=159417 RepID=UPI00404146C8